MTTQPLQRQSEPTAESHRERLIAAMAAAVESRGFRDTTVADVVRIARTSRRTFYEHFADREACFLALFDSVQDAMIEDVAAAVHPEAPVDEQVDSALDAFLDSVTARPALHRSFVRELPSLGQPGAERQIAVIERFASLLVELVESARHEHPEIDALPLTMDVAIIIVGGLRELAIISLQRGRDVREVRTAATATVKAILAGTLL